MSHQSSFMPEGTKLSRPPSTKKSRPWRLYAEFLPGAGYFTIGNYETKERAEIALSALLARTGPSAHFVIGHKSRKYVLVSPYSRTPYLSQVWGNDFVPHKGSQYSASIDKAMVFTLAGAIRMMNDQPILSTHRVVDLKEETLRLVLKEIE